MLEPQAFTYLSTRAGADPVKTLVALAPNEYAATYAGAEEFARLSGWLDEAELDGAALMVPVVPDGWEAAPDDVPLALYRTYCRSFSVAPGTGIPGGGDVAWAWETLIYVAGYEEGSTYAARFLAAHPGVAAAMVLVDGNPADCDAWDAPSEHWLVPEPVDYDARNSDVPVAVWLMGAATDAPAFVERIRCVNGVTRAKARRVADVRTLVEDNSEKPGPCLMMTPELSGCDRHIAHAAMEGLFNQVIRWKNGPDGALSPHISRADYLADGTYGHVNVEVDGEFHHYATYLPKGLSKQDVHGLPLVISVHGRGEPSWIFAQKNGWEHLADETQAFVVMLPDSHGNIWSADRDAQAFEMMVADAVERLGLDAERVYLTGFSNGAMFTCQMATARPGLFAAASPWNSPGEYALSRGGLGSYLYHPDFSGSGYEIPWWSVYGDADSKAPMVKEAGFSDVLAANGCAPVPAGTWNGSNRYTLEAGYFDGDRMSTEVFANKAGAVMTGFTVMKNMPHGAIADEARACWEFMKRFRRVNGGQSIEEVS